MSNNLSAPEHPSVRRAYRSVDGTYLGGVAGGLAEHLGVDAMYVRLFFVVTSIFGLGILLYAGLWMTLPLQPPDVALSPGLAAATRQGKRPGGSARLRESGPVVAWGALVLGALATVFLFLGGPVAFWPLALAVLGVGVLWWQMDEAQRERWLDTTGRADLSRIFLGGGGLASWARVATGIGLLLTALVIFAAQTGQITAARDIILAGTLGMLGLAVTLGPWLFRLGRDLAEERTERIRSQERADVAAHLHDSVLQTLALIQKNAADPTQVSKLARAQERDLREWMYGELTQSAETVAAALREVAADIEDAHGCRVEVVTVGDVALTEPLVPLVQAAREAIVNAAKHSGADTIDVYAEIGPAGAEVFIRDRGCGFDPQTVPADRLGVRKSIEDRMARHGGTAVVRSAPGAGTEIRLELKTRVTTTEPRTVEHG